ncbi:tigger transposable element-derived protein 4-like [Hydra vulgaris]|uniref:Tigger transposable element-derived protein 4-like n=1 Tax=Hydra vulgaris TaxID=6087 RepID=A0ABM4BPH2_HYDVU
MNIKPTRRNKSIHAGWNPGDHKRCAILFFQKIIWEAQLAKRQKTSAQGLLRRKSSTESQHNVVFRTISGEETSCTAEKTSIWEQTHLPTIPARYELRDVYNADEFGLFYQQPPTKTFHLKGERCAGGKLSKVRLTGIAAGNGVGEKLSMFIIRKAEKPRCFKGVESLPCQYKSQNNSCMDSKIFTDYVRRLDAKFNAEGRKVALIIDNCPAHPNVENLKAIELVFLPPNTTSKTQPMDQGVIRALKTFYRTNVVRRQIKYIDVGKTTPNINILKAMSIKAGISKEISVASINGEEEPFELLEENVKELRSRGLVEKDFAVEDYVKIDFDICTSEAIAITDREILDSILINDCTEVIFSGSSQRDFKGKALNVLGKTNFCFR